MEIRRQTIGTTTGHAKQDAALVDAYTLDTGEGLTVTVWTFGASLIEAIVPDRHGRMDNVVVRLPDLASYEDRSRNPYLGATLGRYARCIAGARLCLDGREYRLSRNEGAHHIHGGTIGFDRFVWDADAGRDRDRVSVRLRLERPDGDEGYPGALSAETVYSVEAGGRLRFEHSATTTGSTVVALTNHAFWNLAGAGTVNEHRLAINTARVLMPDEDLIPVGGPVDVSDTRLDYSTPQPLGVNRLDHCFVLDNPAWAADLSDPRSGRVMRVRTDQPGLQVYSADGFAQPRTGLSLQTGAWPNSPNRPDYPSSRLDPGETYRHETVHEFEVG